MTTLSLPEFVAYCNYRSENGEYLLAGGTNLDA